MKQTLVLSVSSLVIAFLLSGCVSIYVTADSRPTTSPSPTERPWIPTPDGFTRAGDVAYRWLEPGSLPCSDISPEGCYFVEVYAMKDCTNGVSIEATLYDKEYNGVVVGSASGSLSRLEFKQTGRIELPAQQGGAWARLADASCR